MTVPDKQRVTPHMARDPWHLLSSNDERQIHRLLAFGRDMGSTRLPPQGPSGIERAATRHARADEEDDGFVECERCMRAVPPDDIDEDGRCDRCAAELRP